MRRRLAPAALAVGLVVLAATYAGALHPAGDSLGVGRPFLAALLVVALVTGVAIGLFQALTSVQEMTLTFVPKIGLMLVVFWVSMSFMTATLAGFFTDQILPQIAGS